jgi:hypothetical protein
MLEAVTQIRRRAGTKQKLGVLPAVLSHSEGRFANVTDVGAG